VSSLEHELELTLPKWH